MPPAVAGGGVWRREGPRRGIFEGVHPQQGLDRQAGQRLRAQLPGGGEHLTVEELLILLYLRCQVQLICCFARAVPYTKKMEQRLRSSAWEVAI